MAENSELKDPDKQACNDSGIFSGFVRNISFAYSLSKSLLLRDSTNKPLLGQVALCCFFFPSQEDHEHRVQCEVNLMAGERLPGASSSVSSPH